MNSKGTFMCTGKSTEREREREKEKRTTKKSTFSIAKKEREKRQRVNIEMTEESNVARRVRSDPYQLKDKIS